MQLAGKKVVVVGGSSGIGLSTAELAKADGADVVIASRNAEKLNVAAAKLGVKTIQADVTGDDSVAKLFKQCGPGRSRRGHRRATQNRAVQVGRDGRRARDHGGQVLGRLALRARGRNPCRRLAHIGLRLPEHPAAPQLRDCRRVTNGALKSLTRALALKLAPVRVNCSLRPALSTRRSAPPCRKPPARRCSPTAATALPVGRVGLGEDIAQQILAFMTNSFASGSIIYLDGGALVT